MRLVDFDISCGADLIVHLLVLDLPSLYADALHSLRSKRNRDETCFRGARRWWLWCLRMRLMCAGIRHIRDPGNPRIEPPRIQPLHSQDACQKNGCCKGYE